MAHKVQQQFCFKVRSLFPKHFQNVEVLDVGSLDINGNNRIFFTPPYAYTGIDIGPGENVHIIMPVHEYAKIYDGQFDVVISTEMLEHDKYFRRSLEAMYKLLKPNGLLIITCATTGRPVHGTRCHEPMNSPYTWDWYKNITKEMFFKILPRKLFKEFDMRILTKEADLHFWGVKSKKPRT